MLTITHALKRSAPLATDPERCHAALKDFIRHVENLSEVASVESYPDDLYRIILRKLGGQVGAFQYGVHVAFDVQLVEREHGVTARSLPRDPHDSWIGTDILLGDYHSETRYRSNEDGVELTHEVEVRVDLPLQGVLKLAPRPLIQAIGDGMMQQKTAGLTDEMFARLLTSLARP